jgi:hypothetical protein
MMGLTIIGSQNALGQAPSLKFLSSSDYIDTADIFHVVGEIQNNSPSVLKFVKIIGTFYDSNNRVVATSNTFTDPPDLSAGGKAPFDLTVLSASVPVREISNYRLTATSEDQNISVQSENIAPLSGGGNTTASENGTVSMPISQGFVDGKIAYFIATDASSKEIVSSVSSTTSFKVNYAPSLADTPQSSRQQAYVFINGMKGEGSMESQMIVASALPEDGGYSPLFELNYVKWDANAANKIRVLKSVDEIMAAEKNGELTITKSNIVINNPIITTR